MTNLLESELLARVPSVVHGFSTRFGGASTQPFAALNLSFNVGDARASVVANRETVLRGLGKNEARLIAVKQVHGDAIVQVTSRAGTQIEADGLVTTDRDAVLAILVADCVPILVADGKGRFVAALHAGWRGTQAKIISRLIERLEAFKAEPSDLWVAMGPAIGPCCFEIGADVQEALRAAFPDCDGIGELDASGKAVADLWSLNQHTWLSHGVPASQIDTLRTCTKCSMDFFSYRRDAGKTGRQAGLIGFS